MDRAAHLIDTLAAAVITPLAAPCGDEAEARRR